MFQCTIPFVCGPAPRIGGSLAAVIWSSCHAFNVRTSEARFRFKTCRAAVMPGMLMICRRIAASAFWRTNFEAAVCAVVVEGIVSANGEPLSAPRATKAAERQHQDGVDARSKTLGRQTWRIAA